MTELQEYLDEEFEPAEERREAWSIQNDSTADWALRKIREDERILAGHEETAQREIERVNEWIERMRHKAASDTAYLRGALESYMRGVNDVDPKRKSLALPNGSLQLRKDLAKWNWPETGEEYSALLSYATEHKLTRVRVELDKAGIKKACCITDAGQVVDANGEIVPGIIVEESQWLGFSLKTEG